MNDFLEKFQRLLRELFQFDCADLDFGIYRIMNYKRDAVEKFIIQDLPSAVAKELDRGVLCDQSQAAKELKDFADQIRQTLGKEALDADGNLAETYLETPLGKKYLNLKEKATGGRGREVLETTISHTSTPSLADTIRKAISSPSAATPSARSMLSPTMVKKFTSTGPITISIT